MFQGKENQRSHIKVSLFVYQSLSDNSSPFFAVSLFTGIYPPFEYDKDFLSYNRFNRLFIRFRQLRII